MNASTLPARIAGRIGAVATLLVNGAAIAVTLWRWRARFAAAEVIVLYEEGGFGHTVIGPDGMRRLFRGKKNLMIFFYQRDRHNPHITALWRDIDVMLLPLWQGFGDKFTRAMFVWRRSSARFAARVLRRLLRAIWPDKMVLSLDEFNMRLPDYGIIPSPNNPHANMESTRYLALRQKTPAPALHFPPSRLESIRERITSLPGSLQGSSRRLACLYLREKGDPVNSPESYSRNGGGLDDYRPAVALLIDRGYRVALIGDRTLSPSMREKFRGHLVDAESVGVEPDLFQLYAATEADIFVGEAGGGSWISPINDIPSLIVNAFPYLLAQPGATLLYKELRTTTGELVSFPKLFGELLFDSSCTGYVLMNNTPMQIRDAVAEFLDFTDQKNKPSVPEQILRYFPADAWIRFMDARISPVWLELYRIGTQPARSAATR